MNREPSENRFYDSQTFHPLLLGGGKVASHLHHYFHQKNVPHSHWLDARDLSEAFYQKLEKCSSVWLLVADQAIEELKLTLQKRKPSLRFVHASGSLSIANVNTLHPIMTFGPELYELQEYEKIPFTVIEEEWIDQPTDLLAFFSLFPNPRNTVSSKDRARYHANCVMTSNFPQILWRETYSEVFKPLLQKSVQNFLEHGEKALTGPLQRGDQATIEKHLTALKDSPLHDLYQEFVKFYNVISQRRKS